MKATVREITDLVGGKLLAGQEGRELSNFASLDLARSCCVSFFGNEKYLEQFRNTEAGAILVPTDEVIPLAPSDAALILVENPVLAFDQVLKAYGPQAVEHEPGVSETAFVDASASVDPTACILANATVAAGAEVGADVTVGYGAVIGENSVIGAGTQIGANAVLTEGSVVGSRVIIHAGAVIGADGFGFEFVEGRHQKIDQNGIVRIEDDVEIGAGTTIDRARFGETVIGEGTKVDNLVQIGHNVVIGKHCIIVAQTGISGSARIGDYVTLAAQCGVAGHLRIADRVTCGGRSGVISSIDEPGGTYFGYPAKPLKEDRRESMHIKKLGGLLKRVARLEKLLETDDN